MLQPPSLKEITSRDYEHGGGFQKRDYRRASSRREKIQIIGAEEILDLPCGFFFRMAALLNLVASA
jgi:hypothetical protein